MGVRFAGGLTAILFIAFFAVVPAKAAETTKLAPPGAPFDIDRALGADAYDAEKSWGAVRSIRINFGTIMASHPQRALYYLRVHMLRITTKVVASHQRRLNALDWHPKFKSLFAKARAWRKELNAMTMDEVHEVQNSLYRLAEITKEKKLKRRYINIARDINHLLLNLNHMPTRFEFALKKLNRNDEIDTEDALAWIKFLANHGDYAPAQIYGAQIHLKQSEGKTKARAGRSRMAAYYWLRKAVKSDPSIRALMKKVRRMLTPAQIEKVESRLGMARGR